MSSRAHRWPAGDTPLTGFHWGCKRKKGVVHTLPPAPKKKRKRLKGFSRWALEKHMQSQKDACYYCAVEMVLYDPYARPTLDHIVPLSRGGKDTLSNTCAACFVCNVAKSNLDVADFMRNFDILRKAHLP